MTSTFTANDVAREFSRIVREYLGEHLDEINRRNATPDYVGCCATHDFCDSNMLMLEAYARVSGIPESEHDFGDEATCAIVNTAWDAAKASKFADIKR